MTGRLFTVEQANALLPTLIPLIEQLMAARDRIAEAGGDLLEMLERSPGNGGGKLASETAADIVAIQEIIGKINALGCELKDIEQGLIDFPAEHPSNTGDIIYLCWRYGEEKVEWWHEIDGGFAGRQRL